jgi:hypothetical protein
MRPFTLVVVIMLRIKPILTCHPTKAISYVTSEIKILIYNQLYFFFRALIYILQNTNVLYRNPS